MNNWIVLLFIYSTRSHDFNNYKACPRPCECYVTYTADEPTVHVFCSIAKLSNFDFSRLETNVTSVLHITCESLLHSYLQDRIFQHLYSFSAFELSDCSFDNIHEHAFYGLRNLRELYINKARDLSIHDKAFFNTPNIRRLVITNSGVTQFPPLFGLNKIQFINFTNNVIKDISNDNFIECDEPLNDLFVLILNNNRIHGINVTFGRFTPNLKYLSIADNMVADISSQSLLNLTYLELLDLTGNQLSELPSTLLKDNVNIKVVGLGPNPISQIDDGFFHSGKVMEVLVLGSTRVGDSIWNHLYDLPTIHELQLGNCSLTYINITVMGRLRRLQHLDLSRNNLSKIFNYTFINHVNLVTLLLSHNEISYIESHAFHGLRSINKLDLTSNQLKTLHPLTLNFMPDTTMLNISYNELNHFPGLHNLTKLFVLDLRHNRISKLDKKSFVGLPNLAGINLSWNKLTALRRNVFQNSPNLELLQVSNNDIKLIEGDAFKNMSKLKWLLLKHNNIKNIAYIFTNMLSLLQLDLGYNKIDGPIHAGHFYNSFALQQIILNNNHVTGIVGSAFSNFQHLEIVDLKYNNISSLQPYNIKFSPLTIPPPVFYFLGNRFNCDCHLSWMRQCLNRWTDSCKGLEIDEFEFLLCYSGYKIRKFSLIKNAQLETMLCEFENPCVGICDCCGSLSCNCKMSCPTNCTCLMSFNHQSGIVDCSNKHINNVTENILSVAETFYLDGNDLVYIKSAIFSGLHQLKTLYLNKSGIDVIQPNSFVNLTKLKSLYLNENSLSCVDVELLNGLVSLKFLQLEHNNIAFIAYDAFKRKTHLEVLRLAYNKLVSLPYGFAESVITLKFLTLSNNQWSCDCDDLHDFKELTYELADVIYDRHNMYCFVNNTKNESFPIGSKQHVVGLDYWSICPNQSVIFQNRTIEKHREVLNYKEVQALTSTLVILVLFILIFTLVFMNRTLIQVVIYNKFGIRLFSVKPEENKMYDAFVSYSHKDEGFVARELVQRLENNDDYKLCVHFRDFPIGACIADTIIRSVEESSRTIMIVSNNYLDSEWCQYEFQTAHHSVLRDKSQKIILILMEDIDPAKLDPELKLYMKTKTYLKRTDPWFWEKLVFALPVKEKIKIEDQQLNDLNKINIEFKDEKNIEFKDEKNIDIQKNVF
ncbi:toll-like receptor Tollo isoform X2 [Mytilus edulis]